MGYFSFKNPQKRQKLFILGRKHSVSFVMHKQNEFLFSTFQLAQEGGDFGSWCLFFRILARTSSVPVMVGAVYKGLPVIDGGTKYSKLTLNFIG